jgi:AcrR family transcriptional regulator
VTGSVTVVTDSPTVADADHDEPAVARRPGRPPDLAKRVAVLDAARELLAEVGYSSMTIDAVARRAGLNRVLIYRVWDTKLALAADAILARQEPLVVPDRGSLIEDLEDFVGQLVDHMRQPAYVKGVPGLTVELLNDPATTRDIWRRYVGPSDRGFGEILDRAVERGELAERPDASTLTRVVSGITTGLAQTGRLSRQEILDVALAALVGGVLRPS